MLQRWELRCYRGGGGGGAFKVGVEVLHRWRWRCGTTQPWVTGHVVIGDILSTTTIDLTFEVNHTILFYILQYHAIH